MDPGPRPAGARHAAAVNPLYCGFEFGVVQFTTKDTKDPEKTSNNFVSIVSFVVEASAAKNRKSL